MLLRKFFNLLIIKNYTIKNPVYSLNYRFVVKNPTLIYKIIKKYDKKLKSLKKDWVVTQKYFYFFINVNWEDIFTFFIYISTHVQNLLINYIYILNFTIKNTLYSKYNIIEDLYCIIYSKTKFNDFNKITYFKKKFNLFNQFISNFNIKLTLKLFVDFLFIKNTLNSFEFLTISWLCFEYIMVPYYYLDHWFEIQLESLIIYFKILLIKHYSNSKMLVCLSKKHYNLFYLNIFKYYKKLKN